MTKFLLASALAFGFVSGAIANDIKLIRTEPNAIPAQTGNLLNSTRKLKATPLDRTGNILDPHRKAPRRAVSSGEGFILIEDFEGWDGTDENWLPEGWTMEHKSLPESDRRWKMTKPIDRFDLIDSKCLTFELFEQEVDEWVITPEIKVESGMELSWATITSPYFFDFQYFNSTTFQLDKYVIVNDMKVNVSVDGGETWETVFSHATDLMENAPSFFAMFDYTVRPFSVSLEEFVGSDILIGFQIVGREGNTTFLDDVRVGLPLTDTSYTRPLSNLFLGLSDRDEYLPASIMVGPVFEPVKYTNTTPNKSAEFEWTYEDTDGKDKKSYVKDLQVTYATDYTSESTTRNNLYAFPVLHGSSVSTAPNDFTYPGFYQAGGRGEYERLYTDTGEREVVQLGLSIVDPMTEGTATYSDIAVPYFGYNQESDNFWSRYTFGNEYNDQNWTHLEKYANLFYSPDSPLVIDGIRTNAYGKISRDAVFTADIYFLNRSFEVEDTPRYSLTCTGDDITVIDRYSSSDFISLNFKSDEPIVISKSVTPYFSVAIGGFRDPEHIDYFSPEMSANTNPNNLGLGWFGCNIMFEGSPVPFSWGSVTGVTGDDLRVAFYIMLDATFPWLKGEQDSVDIIPNGTATMTLDSYYDGSMITFSDMPEWLSATAEGRYGNTVITFTASGDAATDVTAKVKIEAPGLSKSVDINLDASGIDAIQVSPIEGSDRIYTLDGREVSGNPSPGIYIKISGGKASKVIF